VFWITAGSDETTKSDDIAKRTDGIKREFIRAAEFASETKGLSFEAAKLWFENTTHTWLLIMDNADDVDINYNHFLPSSGKGSIIMTTRNHGCTTYGTAGDQKFEKLEFEDAVTLLLKACGEETDRKDHEKDAKAVVEVLVQHPLAITQAGAYIRQGLCKLSEYPTKFVKQRERLLRYHSDQAKSIYRDVYTTFEVSATYSHI
jgi:hypothetical protein